MESFKGFVEAHLVPIGAQLINVAKQKGHAFECVLKGDAEGLLCFRELDFRQVYRDTTQNTTMTLFGLCVLRRRYKCMKVMLWRGADPDETCAVFRLQCFGASTELAITGRYLCEYSMSSNIILRRFERRRAQLSATQWVLVNIPACWRDLSEDVLRRFRYA